MHFIEPEALAEPRRRKSASASGSVSSQLILIVQVDIFHRVLLFICDASHFAMLSRAAGEIVSSID